MLQPRSVWHLPPFYDLENLCGIHLELTMDFSSLANTSNFTSIIQGVSHHSLLYVLFLPSQNYTLPKSLSLASTNFSSPSVLRSSKSVVWHLKTCREPSRDDANWQWIHIIRSSIWNVNWKQGLTNSEINKRARRIDMCSSYRPPHLLPDKSCQKSLLLPFPPSLSGYLG